jgi:hypothetical protein
MANDIIPRLKVRRNSRARGEIGRDERVRGPGPRVATRDQASLVDLGPFEGDGVDGVAGGAAVGYVVDYGACGSGIRLGIRTDGIF